MPRDWNAIALRLSTEELLPLSKAAKLVPTDRGKRGHASASALHRWIHFGKDNVFLDAMKIGHGFFTSREALARFHAGVTAAAMPDQHELRQLPTEEERRARARAALADLEPEKKPKGETHRLKGGSNNGPSAKPHTALAPRWPLRSMVHLHQPPPPTARA